MKLKKTSKKFYNKWLYKVTLSIDKPEVFRITNDMAELRDFLTGCKTIRGKRIYDQGGYKLKIVDFLEKFDKTEWSRRVEYHQVDFYTNNQELYQGLLDEFKQVVIHAFEPDENAISQLESPGVIAVKNLPHNRYRYKVFLKPHAMAYDYESKQKFLDWLVSQQPKVTCSSSIQSWFLCHNWNWDRRYILVEDENTLLMLKLRNANAIGKVYNFQVIDK